MKKHLNASQRGYAQHRLMFSTDLLSLDLAESLRRTSLACAENKKKQAGIVDFICGLFLQDRVEMTRHFGGSLASVVTKNFPIHRFGNDGLRPRTMLDPESSEEGFYYSFEYSDDVLHLVWLGQKLASAVGKKASLKDVIAAATLNREWMDELSRSGLRLEHAVADFDHEVGTIVFHKPTHMDKAWSRELTFDLDKEFQPPFRLEVSTPSGPLQPVRLARVKLNGEDVADVSWPKKPTTSVQVQLRTSNKIDLELDGPPYGSMDLTIRGIAP